MSFCAKTKEIYTCEHCRKAPKVSQWRRNYQWKTEKGFKNHRCYKDELEYAKKREEQEKNELEERIKKQNIKKATRYFIVLIM